MLTAALLAIVAAAAIGCQQSVAPTSLNASPVTSAGPETPRPTAWPGNAVLGINALGVADGQIHAAIDDLNKGIATEDLALMRSAANGLAGLNVLLPNVTQLDGFQPMHAFAAQYGAAIQAIIPAATSLRAAIDAHDAAAITPSTQALLTGLTLYAAVQPQLADWVDQSTEQQRLLVQ
jgi:hypothetical protein